MDQQQQVRDVPSVSKYTSCLYYDTAIPNITAITPIHDTNSQLNLTKNDLLEAIQLLGNKAVGIDGLKDTHLKEIFQSTEILAKCLLHI
jgi:hypothetical protein